VKPIAIIIPIERVLNNLLQSSTDRKRGLSDTAEAQRLVLNQLQQQAREYDLPSLGIVEAVVLSPLKEWDLTNVSIIFTQIIKDKMWYWLEFQGMTTAVGKLKRKAILNHHRQSIEELRIDTAK
jgi:hypothetical protein